MLNTLTQEQVTSIKEELNTLVVDLRNFDNLYPYERSYVRSRLQELTRQCEQHQINLTSLLEAPISAMNLST